jgi:hypothetical protein
MTARIERFPATGWCVRPGIRCAHHLFFAGGRLESACGGVERLDVYVPQRLRPLQAGKPRCLACELRLRKAAGR